MSKPIDLKTVKIFEPLKKKPSFENKIFNTINAEEVYDVLSRNSNETATTEIYTRIIVGSVRCV